MSNDLTSYMTSGNLPTISNEEMAGALQESADDASTGGGSGVDFLTFSGKTGKFLIGQSKSELDLETLFLVEPASVIEGWICWKGGKPVGRKEWSIYKRSTQAIPESDLEDHGPYNEKTGDGWKTLLGFGMATLDEKATPVKFSVNSTSALNAVSDLTREIGSRLVAGEPELPVIMFDAETFVAQEVTNWKPVLDVQVWTTRAAAEAYFNGSLSEEDFLDGEQPKKKKAKRRSKK